MNLIRRGHCSGSFPLSAELLEAGGGSGRPGEYFIFIIKTFHARLGDFLIELLRTELWKQSTRKSWKLNLHFLYKTYWLLAYKWKLFCCYDIVETCLALWYSPTVRCGARRRAGFYPPTNVWKLLWEWEGLSQYWFPISISYYFHYRGQTNILALSPPLHWLQTSAL